MLLYESFLRSTHSNTIKEWFQDLQNLLSELLEAEDPSPEDIQLVYHMTNIVENFQLMESNLTDRRRKKQKTLDDIYTNRPRGSSVMFE